MTARLLALALAGGVLLATPAQAATPTPNPSASPSASASAAPSASPSAGASATPTPTPPPTLTPEEQAAAAARAAEEEQARVQVAELSSEVAAAAAQLTEGTRRLEEGQAHLDEVEAEAARVRREADAAMRAAEEAKARLAEVVGEAYRAGRSADLGLALSAQPHELNSAVLASAELEHVLGSQADVLREATARSVAAEDLVRRAEQLEADARAEAAALEVQVGQLRSQAEQTQVRLEAAAARLQAAQEARRQEAERKAQEAAEAAALARAGDPLAPVPYDVSGGAATCDAPADAVYANGFLPPEALCPLAVGAGHRLRAEAARSFNRLLSKRLLCVTDSYRSYAAQVSVYARKPGLAAVPGTSNHGLGLAVDLCGGVERFGSEAYVWMKEHAPAYGWVHPSWAEPDGSKPEPWHWEFVGVPAATASR